MIFEKVRFLQSMKVFGQTTGLLLSYVADNMPVRKIMEGETLNLGGELSRYFIIVRTGRLNYYIDGELSRELKEKKFIGETVDSQDVDSNRLLVGLEDSTILLISKDRYYELLSDNLLFAQAVIRHMTA